jgi:mono/diheme cytochrome c family protein
MQGMKKRIAVPLALLALVAAILFWLLTIPERLDPALLADIESGDAAKGEQVFWAGGCGSCHAEKSAKGENKKLLGGGHRLDTPAGVFVTPNISPDAETGIGAWSGSDFANAMMRGVSPEGSHYYPSFPYTSYAKMQIGDVADLWAYMKTLPAVSRVDEPHELALPFKLRRGTGLWKRLFLSAAPVVKMENPDRVVARGQYLVESMGHCGECHTQRSLFGFGGPDHAKWLAGGPAPEGNGKIPNITSDPKALGSWSTADIASYLESGFTPDFDSVGGSMVSVQENMSKLTAADRDAIAAYLKAIPPVAN